jgi:hypothetical protein
MNHEWQGCLDHRQPAQLPVPRDAPGRLQITGGTGLFAHASCAFTGTISPQGLLPRNPYGSCAAGKPSLHEVDKVTFSGTLSF